MGIWSVNEAGSTPFFSSAARIIARFTGCGPLHTDVRWREPVEGEVERGLHVGERVDRGAGAAHLAGRERMIGVEAVGGGQVVLDDQAREALIEHVARALRPLLAGAEAGHLRHRPEAAAIAVRLGAARVGILAREADVAQVVEADRLEIERRVEPVHGPAQRLRLEVVLALAAPLEVGAELLRLPRRHRAAEGVEIRRESPGMRAPQIVKPI